MTQLPESTHKISKFIHLSTNIKLKNKHTIKHSLASSYGVNDYKTSFILHTHNKPIYTQTQTLALIDHLDLKNNFTHTTLNINKYKKRESNLIHRKNKTLKILHENKNLGKKNMHKLQNRKKKK